MSPIISHQAAWPAVFLKERSRVAATLTGSGELLYASFPIDKVETDADGDLIVFGKASDGSVDSDQQVVAPSWMRDAAVAWKESGANLRVQHNAQRDPAGVGLEVEIGRASCRERV